MKRQFYGFNERRIQQRYKQGRGAGHGISYQPWHKVRDVPSCGRSHRLLGMTTGRSHYFHSDIEYRFFHLLDLAEGVTDIREHYPLDRERTLRIAREKKVRHPRDVRTRDALVMTTDFLIDTVCEGRTTLKARAVKYSEKLGSRRPLETLEIERSYWAEFGVDWGVVTEKDISRIAARNLQYPHGYFSLSDLTQPYPGYFDGLARRVLHELPKSRAATLGEFCAETDALLSIERGRTLMLIRHLLQRKHLLFPLHAEEIGLEQPLRLFKATGGAE